MKNVLNFPNYNTFFLSTKKKVFNGMSRIIAYSKSHFMLTLIPQHYNLTLFISS